MLRDISLRVTTLGAQPAVDNMPDIPQEPRRRILHNLVKAQHAVQELHNAA
jgi:hypothetical protein